MKLFIKYSILYFIFIFVGVLLLDNEKLRKYNDNKRFLARFVIFLVLMIPLAIIILIDLTTEKGYTLYKLFNYYNLKYGDTVDFIYHIKTRYKNDNTTKTPKCKIEGKIESNNLKITKMKDCDENEDVKEMYKELITHTGDFDDNKFISVGSEIKNFTWD